MHNSPAPALVWHSREASQHLLHGWTTALGIALASGLLLLLDVGGGHTRQVLLVAHLVAGGLGAILFPAYLAAHIKDGGDGWGMLVGRFRRPPGDASQARARRSGPVLAWSTLVVLASGLSISVPALFYLAGTPRLLPYGLSADLLNLHLGATAVLAALLTRHLPWRPRS